MKLRVFAAVVASALFTTNALAQTIFSAKLAGLRETPIVISGAAGHAKITISHDEKSIDYELTYNGLEGSTGTGRTVTQAHIHIGRPTVVGGVSVFFCGGGNTEATKKLCPASAGPGTPNDAVTGTWRAADITGPASQGVEANNPNGEDAFARLVGAIKAGLSYANVHSSRSPGGEIRGQLKRERDNDHDNDDDDR
ncbi:MAG: hypothetical protein DMG63_00855 [Acidobacteria bacterium]|nr:MAG: hypothetical protein DMG63_00855 [Acidobacteriota bacterium]